MKQLTKEEIIRRITAAGGRIILDPVERSECFANILLIDAKRRERLRFNADRAREVAAALLSRLGASSNF